MEENKEGVNYCKQWILTDKENETETTIQSKSNSTQSRRSADGAEVLQRKPSFYAMHVISVPAIQRRNPIAAQVILTHDADSFVVAARLWSPRLQELGNTVFCQAIAGTRSLWTGFRRRMSKMMIVHIQNPCVVFVNPTSKTSRRLEGSAAESLSDGRMAPVYVAGEGAASDHRNNPNRVDRDGNGKQETIIPSVGDSDDRRKHGPVVVEIPVSRRDMTRRWLRKSGRNMVILHCTVRTIKFSNARMWRWCLYVYTTNSFDFPCRIMVS